MPNLSEAYIDRQVTASIEETCKRFVEVYQGVLRKELLIPDDKSPGRAGRYPRIHYRAVITKKNPDNEYYEVLTLNSYRDSDMAELDKRLERDMARRGVRHNDVIRKALRKYIREEIRRHTKAVALTAEALNEILFGYDLLLARFYTAADGYLHIGFVEWERRARFGGHVSGGDYEERTLFPIRKDGRV